MWVARLWSRLCRPSLIGEHVPAEQLPWKHATARYTLYVKDTFSAHARGLPAACLLACHVYLCARVCVCVCVCMCVRSV